MARNLHRQFASTICIDNLQDNFADEVLNKIICFLETESAMEVNIFVSANVGISYCSLWP
jgi:hypothetical protein